MEQEKLLKSVVRIHAYGRPVDCAKPFLTADRFKGVGTGFFINPSSSTENLYILTCSHVIEGADTVTIMLPLLGLSEYPASVLAMLPSYDLAVVVVTGEVASDLKDKTSPLEVGQSTNLQLGQKLIAVGYPLGQTAIKVSDGVYSGFQNKLQHTVSISPGNSGGPLINDSNQVVGVNSSGIISPEASNIGFAVPIEMYQIMSPRIFENSPGSPSPQRVVRQPTFGFKFSPITMSHAKLIGSCVGDHGGVQIVSVVPNTDMSKHLSPGDILVEFDGEPIDTIGEVKVPWNYQKVKLQDLLARSVEDRAYPIKFWDSSVKSCSTANVHPNMVSSNGLKFLYPPHDNVPHLTTLGLVIMPLLGNHSQCPPLIQTYVGKSTEELSSPCLIISHIFNGTLAQIEGPLNVGDEVELVNGVRVNVLEDVRKALPNFTEVNGHKAITLKSKDGKLFVVNCLDALQCEQLAKTDSLYSPDENLLNALSITRTKK